MSMSIKRLLKTKKCKRFINNLKAITDSRVQIKVKHQQHSILFIIILAMLSGCNKFNQYYYFGSKHFSQLKKYVDLKNGIPSHDTVKRAMHRINSDELNDVICSYAVDFIDDKNIHVCIDGKFARATKENNHTIDAIATINPILSLIVSYSWDSVICIKSHSSKGNDFYDYIVDEFKLKENMQSKTTIYKRNGRLEKRNYYIITDILNLIDKENWPSVKAIRWLFLP